MTRGPHSRHRPSEEAIRRRLVERRSDYDRRQADTGWSGRIDRLVPGRQPTGRLMRRPTTLFDRLRQRPVTAYLLATIASVALVAILTPMLIGAYSTRGDAPVMAGTAPATGASSPAAGRMAEDGEAGAGQAETGGRLRPAIAAMPETIARPPAMNDAAVAAALDLRLPPEAAQIVATNENPDFFSTTGSVSRIVSDSDSIEPPAPGAIDIDELAPLGPIVPQVPTARTPPSDDSAPLTADDMKIDARQAAETDAAAQATETAAIEPAEATPDASVNASVNMRARPENNATIVTVLERGTAVTVIACQSWCELSVNGQRGFVFRDFVDRRG
ncbi:SH3 domain-containing protein [Aurantimonas sp. A2-1-M11]|uniref:SH3 domain-containing protein n=1 Tax=Aurantimonas sp. A2-1-M11 TaxID=3113712 RepID=UPI002F922D10